MPARPTAIPLLFIFATVTAQPTFSQNTGVYGGSGGTSYVIRCTPYEILVGIGVNAGLWIDRISLWCAEPGSVMTGGYDVSGAATLSAGKAHFGTSEKRAGCGGSPNAVKGLRLTAGQYVNTIALKCAKLGRSWRTDYTMTDVAPIGGVPGPNAATRTCGGQMVAVGIHGRAGEYVDAIGLLCGYVLPSKPVPQGPINGLNVTTKRPTFYWSGGQHDLGKNTICLNTVASADCAAPGTVKAEIEYNLSSWTPTEDLPFQRGTRVYWSINACNDNGCRSGVGYFSAH